MTVTILVRSNNQRHILEREETARRAGFVTSLVTMEPGEFDVWTFDLTVEFEHAQALERRDDRWKVANSFFQQAEQVDGRHGAYAVLASDWASFGYMTDSLADYLAREHKRQADNRAAFRPLVTA